MRAPLRATLKPLFVTPVIIALEKSDKNDVRYVDELDRRNTDLSKEMTVSSTMCETRVLPGMNPKFSNCSSWRTAAAPHR